MVSHFNGTKWVIFGVGVRLKNCVGATYHRPITYVFSKYCFISAVSYIFEFLVVNRWYPKITKSHSQPNYSYDCIVGIVFVVGL